MDLLVLSNGNPTQTIEEDQQLAGRSPRACQHVITGLNPHANMLLHVLVLISPWIFTLPFIYILCIMLYIYSIHLLDDLMYIQVDIALPYRRV